MNIPLKPNPSLIAATLMLAVTAGFSQKLSVGDSIIQAIGGKSSPVIHLWPDGPAPGETAGKIGPERIRDTDGGKIRITDVTDPTITVIAPLGANTGIAVIIAPGGGYDYLVVDREGADVAKRFNQDGITGIVLKYRCPPRAGLDKYAPPLQDAQRAMAIVKSRAKEWGLDSAKVGFCGFSAGGDLGAVLTANFTAKSYPAKDSFDGISSRPDFTLLTYPAYLNGTDKVLTSLDKKTAPYIFMDIGDADTDFYPGYLKYEEMLTSKGIVHESHVYPKAVHAYGVYVDPAGPDWPGKAVLMLKARYPAVAVFSSPRARNVYRSFYGYGSSRPLFRMENVSADFTLQGQRLHSGFVTISSKPDRN
jgi:acetyl esterase/lipase